MGYLVEFENKWKRFYERERDLLLKSLKGQAVKEVKHIGATAVVLSKTAGTIDLLCAIPSFVEFYTLKNILIHKGYQFIGRIGNIEGMYFIRRNKQRKIVATIRIVEYASKKYREILSFLYYLQESRKHVEFYNAFREESLSIHNGDRKQYEKDKANYIRSILDGHCNIE